jgi:hypothetical protein
MHALCFPAEVVQSGTNFYHLHVLPVIQRSQDWLCWRGSGFECQYLCLCVHGVLLNHHSDHQQVSPAVTLFTCIWDTPGPNLNLNTDYSFSRFSSVSRTYAEICTVHRAAIAYLHSLPYSLLAIMRLLSAVLYSLNYIKGRKISYTKII